MRRLPTILEEEEEEERVMKKVCDYMNLSFYMTKIPEDVNDPDFISFLKENDIRAIVRPKEDYLNYMITITGGISDFVINFEDPIPDGFLINLFLSTLKHFIAEEDPMSIAIEESGRGAYVLVYVLVELGVKLEEAVKEINELGLELKHIQMKFLRRKMKKFQNGNTCSIS